MASICVLTSVSTRLLGQLNLMATQMGLDRLNELWNKPKVMNLKERLLRRTELDKDWGEVREGGGRVVRMHYTHL